MFSSNGYADALTQSASVGYSVNKLAIAHIPKEWRKFSSKRQELNRELRKLRRARIASDGPAMAQQERITALERELQQIRYSESEKIRAVLTLQRNAF
ncbi:MAG: hypothetical protein R3F37_23035 [Candidatus Competibacteraceae bacterium]